MRLIDADAFAVFRFTRKSEDFADGVMYVLDKIDEASTIEAEPVRHGYWDMISDNQFWCTECGNEFFLGDATIEMVRALWHYCPKCGAKMDGKENDV